MTDKNFIFVVSTKNSPMFTECYSSYEKANETSKKLRSYNPNWIVSIRKRIIDDSEIGAESSFEEELVITKTRIKKCFDKSFILLIYFSFLTFIWFFFK